MVISADNFAVLLQYFWSFIRNLIITKVNLQRISSICEGNRHADPRKLLSSLMFCENKSIDAENCSHWKSIDDYAKDGGPGEVWLLCSFSHEPLRSWIKTNVNTFTNSSHTALILGTQSLRSYLKLTCEYEFHILPNTKVSIAKDHGENYKKVRPSLVRHLLRNRLFHL